MLRPYPAGWMWAEACELLERAERLHRQCFHLGRAAGGPIWEPPVDVLESAQTLLIAVALPGVRPEGIELHLEPTAVVVTAERPIPREARTSLIQRLEIPYGRFERRIELPRGGYELSEHEYRQGCVHIRLRKL